MRRDRAAVVIAAGWMDATAWKTGARHAREKRSWSRMRDGKPPAPDYPAERQGPPPRSKGRSPGPAGRGERQRPLAGPKDGPARSIALAVGSSCGKAWASAPVCGENPGAGPSSRKGTVPVALDWKPLRLNARPAARRACAAGLFRDCDGAAPVFGCTTKPPGPAATKDARRLSPARSAPRVGETRRRRSPRPSQRQPRPGPACRRGAPVLPVGPGLVPYGVGARGVELGRF
jgi:hypothetical protein